MNIELFLSKKGHLVFTCHGEFDNPIDHITLNLKTGVVTFIFAPDFETWEPNCTVNLEVCKLIGNQLYCVLGYFKDNKLTASEYVRLTCQG